MNKALKNLEDKIRNIKAIVGFSDILYVRELQNLAEGVFDEDKKQKDAFWYDVKDRVGTRGI